MNIKWDLWFLDMAKFVSTRSKDPSTQTGAVIVRPDKTIQATGFNGFPKGMSDDSALYNNREEKYRRIIHCEMNAVLTAGRSVEGCTLYTYPFCSCDRCAVHMIQAGIKRFVFPEASADALTRWGDSLARAKGYMTEMGIEYLEVCPA